MNDDNKYKNWVFTFMEGKSPLPSSTLLKKFLESHSEKYIFQKEKGNETAKEHYQGCFTTRIRTRKSTLLKLVSDSFDITNFTVQRMAGSWDENMAYCSKKDTQIEPPVMSACLVSYNNKDVEFLKEKDKRFPWQQQLIETLFDDSETAIKDASDRQIVWVTDTKGNTGKSKLVKYLCSVYNDIVKISFGTAPQLRSAIISIGIKKVYIVDMPRTKSPEDSVESLISTLEDLKNGFVVSVFYGKYQQLLMEPPHVIVFSNMICPKDKLSLDRWNVYFLERETKTLQEEYNAVVQFNL